MEDKRSQETGEEKVVSQEAVEDKEEALTVAEEGEGKDAVNWEEELLKARTEAQENYNKYLRALADADNQRKRWLREKEEVLRYGAMPIFRQLVSVLDDLKRAEQATEKGGDLESLLKGIRMIEKKLQEILEQAGVKTIPAVGQIFDPERHEALAVEETDLVEDGTILEEYREGYCLFERVIRPSLVKVGRKKSMGGEEQESPDKTEPHELKD